jgi:SAM-dependent methyltransferase
VRVALLLGLAACARRADPGPGDPSNNDPFLAPDVDVAAWTSRFEQPEREVYAHREAIVDAFGLSPGDRVADVGAGTGAFTGPLAAAVGPSGKVYAVDISPAFVEHLAERAASNGLTWVQAVLGNSTTTTLPDDSVDTLVLVDTYHHLDDVEAALADFDRVLAPRGRLVIVEFERIPGVSSTWVLDHVDLGRDEVRAEVLRAGFRGGDVLPVEGVVENYVLLFRAR